MGWPFNFGTATSPVAASHLDDMFNQVGAMISIPCAALGTNAISLTPLTNCPALSSYNELGSYRFVAVGTSTAAVTAQYNGLGFLPVYKIDGTTQFTAGDIVSGEQFIFTFHQALNSGGGGFYGESPSQTLAPAVWGPPGGRLTLVNGQPVLTSSQSGIQNIFYCPYQHQFVPIYNGTIVQMFNFCPSLSAVTGLTLALGGAANFPNAANFDVFAYLAGGTTPALCAIQWTNVTTRATTLSVLGGFLTNSGSATAQTGPNTSFTLPVNQGTFLGTFTTSAQGATNFVFGGAASGGITGSFLLCNYYNKVNFNTTVLDNGGGYTYTSNVIRAARGSTSNAISFVQSDTERTISVFYKTYQTFAAINGAFIVTGIGIGSFGATVVSSQFNNQSAQANAVSINNPYIFAFTGQTFIAAVEASDNANANTFDTGGQNVLGASLWL
jgi:hypothetical protein